MKYILIALLFIGCSKPTLIPTSGNMIFKGITYDPNIKLGYKGIKNYQIVITYQSDTLPVKNLCQLIIDYNHVNRDSTRVEQLQVKQNGIDYFYKNSTPSGKKDSKGNNILIYEYKKNPNIIINSNGTLTINDSFKFFKVYNGSIDTTRYTIYINNITTN